MPDPKHNLPTAFKRLDSQITGPIADAIAIDPRSHGTLHLPGEYSTSNRHPAHQIDINSTDTGHQGVYTEQRLIGSAEHYLVTYDVWNYRDSPSFARIILTEAGTQPGEDTPEG